MRFLIVAERELRAAARRKATHYVRWLTGAVFFLLLVWATWATDALRGAGRAHDAFTLYSVIVFFYCLCVGAIRTADCISSERREGTLGLLFLTNLNSAEIIAGKLCSNALPTVYGLLAIFPMLAMPLLMGGVTLAEFLKCLLALAVAILFSLGCGILSSAVCRRQFPAVALALGLALSLGTLPFAAAAILHEYRFPAALVQGVASFSALYALASSVEGKIFGVDDFWLATGIVSAVSLCLLLLATVWLAGSWRDRVKSARPVRMPVAGSTVSETRRRERRSALRKHLINLNPFYWLAARRQISSPVFMGIFAVLVLVTLFVTTPVFVKLIGRQQNSWALGAMLAWLCTGIGLHLLTLYYAAMVSSQAVAEDRQTGALELIFSTPVQVPTILSGLGAAFRRRMFFPALAVTLTHSYFMWLVMRMAILEPPGPFKTVGMTPWDMLRVSLLNLPVGGRQLEFEFVLMIRAAALVLPLAYVLWFTLGRTGRWLGLRMKHPGFAPLVALALLIVPPTLVYSLGCYIADEAGVFRYSERIVLPLFILSAFAIVLLQCAILAGWAGRHLRENFRQTAIGFPEKLRRSWQDRGRGALKFVIKIVTTFLAICLLVAAYYAYQNHRSRRAWADFQAELNQAGVSIEVSALLPKPVPDAVNFARTPEFQTLKNNTNSPLASLLVRVPTPTLAIRSWRKQEPAVLASFVDYAGMTRLSAPALRQPFQSQYGRAIPSIPSSFNGPTNNADLAPLMLARLKPLGDELEAIAVASRRPWFQPDTNRTAQVVLDPDVWEINTAAQLHMLYTLRSLASLHINDPESAASDLVTSLHLVRLTGQLPNADSSLRAQLMLMTSLQSVWEGLDRHCWQAQQLAEIQAQLETLSPVADFTNSVGRVVRANIELWRQMPARPREQWRIPSPSGMYGSSDWTGLPSDWWFDCCIQLYRAGEDVIVGVAENHGRKLPTVEYGIVNGLPIARESQELFQRMMPYWGSDDPVRLATGQVALDQARIAIALERHRLATGRHPGSLNELVPSLLPRIPYDVDVGRPMHYEQVTNGSYRLRGLGPNQFIDTNSGSYDDNVWAYPTNAPASDMSP